VVAVLPCETASGFYDEFRWKVNVGRGARQAGLCGFTER